MRVDAREGKIRTLEKERKPLVDQIKNQEELIEESRKLKENLVNANKGLQDKN